MSKDDVTNEAYFLSLRYYLVPCSASCGVLMLVGSFLLLHKNFKMHPYPLIGWTCLFESMTYNLELSTFFKCGFLYHDRIKIGMNHSFWFDDYFNSQVSLRVFYNVWIDSQVPMIILNLVLNCLIFIDLQKTLQNPFKPRNLR